MTETIANQIASGRCGESRHQTKGITFMLNTKEKSWFFQKPQDLPEYNMQQHIGGSNETVTGSQVKDFNIYHFNSAKGERLMTSMTTKNIEDSLMKMNRKYADLVNVYGSMEKLIDRAADLASIKSQSTITREMIALAIGSFAEAKASIRPELMENYEEVIIWTMITQGLFNEAEDKGLPRVEKSLTAALAAVDAGMKEQVK